MAAVLTDLHMLIVDVAQTLVEVDERNMSLNLELNCHFVGFLQLLQYLLPFAVQKHTSVTFYLHTFNVFFFCLFCLFVFMCASEFN